jgi:hypothetical protein
MINQTTQWLELLNYAYLSMHAYACPPDSFSI